MMRSGHEGHRALKGFLRREGITALVYPPKVPNCSPIAGRFVRSIKKKCLDRIIPIGVGSLHRTVTEYVVHYHGDRNYQGSDNRLVSSRNVGRLLRGGASDWYISDRSP